MIIIPSEFVHPTKLYNHNVYYNPKTGITILEECHENEYFEYYLIHKNGTQEDLGSLFDDFGIFEINSDFYEKDKVDTLKDFYHGC